MTLIRTEDRRFDRRSATSFTQADLLMLLGRKLQCVFEVAEDPLPDGLSRIVERLEQQDRTFALKENSAPVGLHLVPFQVRPFLRAA